MTVLKTFLKNHWSALLAGAGVALVIVCIAVLTTKTDAISSANSVSSTAVGTTNAVSNTAFDPVSSSSHQVAGSQNNTLPATSSTSSSSDVAVAPEEPTDPYAISLTAESAIVWDVKNHKALFAKNPDKEHPLASLTKLMTALVGAQLARETGKEETVISRQHLDAFGTSGLVAGQSWNVYDLISFMLIESSNDAARAVAAASSEDQADGYAKEFVQQMNDTARGLGLESTYFFNPSGLDLNETLISGGYGSARDTAELFSYILETNQELLGPTTQSQAIFQSLEGISYPAVNTNPRLDEFPETLGSKTGYTVLAGGNLVMAFEFERPIVIVVMGSTQSGRFTDMKTLYTATKQFLAEEGIY